MSKIIKVTPELQEELVKEFANAIKSAKLTDGRLEYVKDFANLTNSKQKAVVRFTATAWVKMVMLIQEFDKEVAWHGVAYRCDGDEHEYVISDILVYPQEVTGATVNTDQKKYEDWMMGHDDETYNNIRMQGHSHVRMGVSPSGVDLTHQAKIISTLDDDMFYIFMIWNKSFVHNIKIYDLAKNILFENKDVSVGMVDDGVDLDAFIKDAKEMVKIKTYTTPTYTPGQGKNYGGYSGGSSYQGSSGPYNPLTAGTEKKPDFKKEDQKPAEKKQESKPANDKTANNEKPRSRIGSGWSGANSGCTQFEMDDYDFYGYEG